MNLVLCVSASYCLILINGCATRRVPQHVLNTAVRCNKIVMSCYYLLFFVLPHKPMQTLSWRSKFSPSVRRTCTKIVTINVFIRLFFLKYNTCMLHFNSLRVSGADVNECC